MAVLFIAIFALLIASVLRLKIPVQEFNLIIYCIICEVFGYISYSITYYYSTPTHIDDLSSDFSGLGYFLSITSVMFVTYCILLIDFRGDPNQVKELIYFTWIGGVTAVYNGITFQAVLLRNAIQIYYQPLGDLFILAFYFYVVYIWVKRFIQINRVYKKQGSDKNISKELTIFIVMGILLIVVYFVFVLILRLHGEFSFISGGVFTIVGITFLVKNNSFLFVTDINLDSIIIIEKQSGMRLYSKVYQENNYKDDDSDFIGSIVSAINSSFSSTIGSNKDLNEMTFSNKTVIVYSGEIVRSILIVSSSNSIANGISKHIVKKFENMFGQEIEDKVSKGLFVPKRNDYLSFNKEIDYVREFLPL